MASNGWPGRVSLDRFGQRRENAAASINPKKVLGADTFNLMRWILAGLNVVSPVAWIVVSAAGARVASGEAWNSDGIALLQPTLSHPSAGVYVVTYAALYPDDLGQPAPLDLQGASPAVRGAAPGSKAVWELLDNEVTIRTSNQAGALVDAGFLLQVW